MKQQGQLLDKEGKFLVSFTKTLCPKLKNSAEKEKNRPTSLIHIDAKLLNKNAAEWEMWYFLYSWDYRLSLYSLKNISKENLIVY